MISFVPTTWEREPDRRYRCLRHGVTFDAGSVCGECHRSPPRPADVAPLPHWIETRYGAPVRRVYRCDAHGHHFETDQACYSCVAADLGEDALEELLLATRKE